MPAAFRPIALLLLSLLAASGLAAQVQDNSLALLDLASRIREAGLDPAECYRVRDLDFTREDARFYLTEGFLIFGKEVNGRRFSAVFVGEIDGGDAEILLFPPARSERMSLAKFTESPNLNEHFRYAAFIFTDNFHAEITQLIQQKFAGRKVPEAGPLYVEKHSGVVRNLSESLELRLVKDLAEGPSAASTEGFFFASIRGSRLGPFDFISDSLARKGIRIGQFSVRENTPYFDMWTEFEPRSVSSGKRPAAREEYTVQHYAISATLEKDLLLKARTRIRVVPHVARQTIAFLIAQDMLVSGARANGQPLEVYRPSATRLNTIRRDRDTAFLVTMPPGAVPGQPVEVEIEHEGRVIEDSGNDVYFVGARGSWFPGAGHRFATYDLEFRIAPDLDFVCTGDRVERIPEEGSVLYRAAITQPVRTFGFNLGKYKKTTVTKDEFTVNVFANRQVETALMPAQRLMVVPTPNVGIPGRRGSTTVSTIPSSSPDPTDRLEQLAAEVNTILVRFRTLFGEPPLKTLNVSPIPGNFGQGFAGMIYLSTIAYLPESQRPAYARDPYSKTFYSDLLLAHEIAHQWWGNLVYSDSDQDEWLMEGLANYSALMMLEQQKGKKPVLEVLQKYRDNLLSSQEDGRTVEDAGPVVWGARLVNSRDRGAWATITYEKGTWIYHMLRARMGEENFLRMLRELPRRFEHKPLSTAAFREFAAGFMAANAADATLEEFFDQWVESTGVPRIQLSTNVTGKAPKVTVQVTLTQSEVPEEFGALVPVLIRFGRDREELRWMRATNDGETESFTFRTVPARVELDPNWQTLRRD